MFGNHFIKAITYSRLWYINILLQLLGLRPSAIRTGIRQFVKIGQTLVRSSENRAMEIRQNEVQSEQDRKQEVSSEVGKELAMR